MDWTYVMGENCSICHFVKPHVEKKATELGKELEIKSYEEMEGINTIPTLITENEVLEGQEQIVLFLQKN